jgi:hypothetical protein
MQGKVPRRRLGKVLQTVATQQPNCNHTCPANHDRSSYPSAAYGNDRSEMFVQSDLKATTVGTCTGYQQRSRFFDSMPFSAAAKGAMKINPRALPLGTAFSDRIPQNCSESEVFLRKSKNPTIWFADTVRCKLAQAMASRWQRNGYAVGLGRVSGIFRLPPVLPLHQCTVLAARAR